MPIAFPATFWGGGSTAWTPASISSIYGWYKADNTSTTTDGASVATWYDSSGKGNNLTQSDSAKQPVYRAADFNGIPTLEGNNSTTSMLNSTFDASNGCMYVVMRPYGTSTLYGGALRFGIGLNSVEIDNIRWTGGLIRFRYNSVGDYGDTPFISGCVVYKIARTGTTAKVKTSLSSESSFAVNYTWSGFELFRNYYSSLGCRIAEAVVCTAELSSADEAALNSYFLAKYDYPTSLLLHMDGTNGSTTFTDSSANALTLTASGSAQISTTQSAFAGGSSGYFPTNQSYLTAPSSALWAFGTGDFTVEFWIYITANQSSQGIVGNRQNIGSAATWQILFYTTSNRIEFHSGAAILLQSTSTVSLNTWSHVAFCRSSGTLRAFLNGTQVGSVANSNNFSTSATLNICRDLNAYASSNGMTGYLDDLRITNGIARYTAAFTPPTAPFPSS